jgi:acetyl-CoA acetyltransferase
MPAHPLRDRAAIVGIGYTEFSKNSGVSTLALALRAIAAAVTDAGLSIGDVDGVACHRVGDSVPAVLVAHSLGIQDLRFHYDLFGGGSASAGVLAGAAMAVATGQAECVVCWRAINARSEWRMGGTGRAAPDTPEFQYLVPYGHFAPPQHFAMFARAYMHAYGVEAEDLGRIAIQQRDNAVKSSRAMMRTPLTMQDYLASRWVAEPLRLYDCCLETDGAVALVVTSAERARDLAHVPVLISGATYGSGHTWFSNHRGDWTTTAAAVMSKRLYEMAGIGPREVDVAELYDAFTPLVLLQLEDYGFCQKGEAAALVAEGATAIGGRLPVNTHGGHLSEGYVHGLNHAVEAVNQLRWACGDRQVARAEVALSTGQPGYVAGSSSAVILRRAS